MLRYSTKYTEEAGWSQDYFIRYNSDHSCKRAPLTVLDLPLYMATTYYHDIVQTECFLPLVLHGLWDNTTMTEPAGT